jgi:hypothetical protein
VNYNHIMPTRYTLDVDLKSVVTTDAVDNSTKRTEARKVRNPTAQPPYSHASLASLYLKHASTLYHYFSIIRGSLCPSHGYFPALELHLILELRVAPLEMLPAIVHALLNMSNRHWKRRRQRN